MVVKSAQDLWCDYLFLTREMDKFLDRDMEMFTTIMEQRQQLQEIIDAHSDKSFKTSAEGRKIIAIIRKENDAITRRMNALMHQHQRRETIEQAYAGGAASRPSGGFVNQKG